VTRDTDVHNLAVALAQDPTEPPFMINGRASPAKAIVAGLAKALDSDVRFLDRLADEIRKHLAAKACKRSCIRSSRPPKRRRPEVSHGVAVASVAPPLIGSSFAVL
jgi:hypothetical protein